MELKAEKRSLRKLLSMEEQQFRIPPYQRPYAWTSEQVDDLWDDLLDNMDSGHLIGSLVLSSEDESRPQVIDGQQRLTTLMLLLSCLREECHGRGLTSLVQKIDKRLIADDLAGGDDYFKFKTGAAKWPVFRDVVLRGPLDSQRRGPGDFDKPTASTPDARDAFKRHLGEMWTAVEPLCTETSAEEMRQLASRLPGHLSSHAANARLADRLAASLEELLRPWDGYNAAQGAVARAAVAYFLESADAVPDDLVGGVVDDDAVVAAARHALAPVLAETPAA